jgi:hypothetical protein
LNFESWKYLNLPLNLYFLLQGKISLCEGGSGSNSINPFIQPSRIVEEDSNQSQMQSQSIQISNLLTNKIEQTSKPKNNLILDKSNGLLREKIVSPSLDQNKKSIRPVESSEIILKKEDLIKDVKVDILKEKVYSNLDKIVGEINDKDKSIDILKKIHTIIINILSNPNEQKYRKLKIDSKFAKTYIEPYKSAKNFLTSIKFQTSTDSQYLEYTEDVDYLSRVTENFNDYLIERSKY